MVEEPSIKFMLKSLKLRLRWTSDQQSHRRLKEQFNRSAQMECGASAQTCMALHVARSEQHGRCSFICCYSCVALDERSWRHMCESGSGHETIQRRSLERRSCRLRTFTVPMPGVCVFYVQYEYFTVVARRLSLHCANPRCHCTLDGSASFDLNSLHVSISLARRRNSAA